jgi:hypothetical protein
MNGHGETLQGLWEMALDAADQPDAVDRLDMLATLAGDPDLLAAGVQAILMQGQAGGSPPAVQSAGITPRSRSDQ